MEVSVSIRSEKPEGAEQKPRTGDGRVPELDAAPLTPEAEAKVKAGLGSTSSDDDLKGLTSN